MRKLLFSTGLLCLALTTGCHSAFKAKGCSSGSCTSCGPGASAMGGAAMGGPAMAGMAGGGMPQAGGMPGAGMPGAGMAGAPGMSPAATGMPNANPGGRYVAPAHAVTGMHRHQYVGPQSHLGAQPGPASGPAAPTVGYPYYTTRGPRDFLNPNPPSIGR